MNISRECCLCGQIAGRKENDLISQLLGESAYVRRVAMESDNFVAIPSLGPLAPGHALLCPKSHIKNFAVLSETLLPEYAAFKARLSSLLSSLFHAPVHYFEHGSAPESSRILCTVDHAHLHFVPADVKVMGAVLSGGAWRQMNCDFRLQQAASAGEYLYYESPEGERFLATGNCFESQHLRRIFAQALGRELSWNWRDNPSAAEVDGTFRAIASASRALEPA